MNVTPQGLRGTSSRMMLAGICAWISMCLLVAGWIPEINDSVSSIWLISGALGLVSAVGLAEAIKSDIRQQESLLKEYMRAALTDGLTGLANRQSLDRTLTSSLATFDSKRCSLGLIMIDIDHFKAFNDQYGHQAGDAVLRCMSRKMAEFFDGKGFSARYGGEEFAVMLPGLGLRQCERLADEFHHLMKTISCEFRDMTFQITVSAGVTEAQDGDTPDSLLRRADLALYSAKKMGRDCIWVTDGNQVQTDNLSLEKAVPLISPSLVEYS